MVSAGPSTIFNLTVMLVEANSTDGGVTLHQSIEPDTGRLAEVQSCLSRLKLQPSSLLALALASFGIGTTARIDGRLGVDAGTDLRYGRPDGSAAKRDLCGTCG